MAKLNVPLSLSLDGKNCVEVKAIVDSGSDVTLFPNLVGKSLGLHFGRRKHVPDVEKIELMGTNVRFRFVNVEIHIPDTDCFIEDFRAGFALGGKDEDIPYAILGVDFLQRTGGILDFGRGRHAIACDPTARGPHSDAPVAARRKRIRR